MRRQKEKGLYFVKMQQILPNFTSMLAIQLALNEL